MGGVYSEAHTEKEGAPEKERRMKVTIDITEKHMDAIEDIFFCENTPRQYGKMRPLLLEVWESLCRSIDEHG